MPNRFGVRFRFKKIFFGLNLNLNFGSGSGIGRTLNLNFAFSSVRFEFEPKSEPNFPTTNAVFRYSESKRRNGTEIAEIAEVAENVRGLQLR
ncbi:hypothetical protein B0H12DRAFT_1108127 [Mycena haematopus]|nr:hypothetical protein B0H12DRAFT_1108127 [Mycena haematopus]